MAIVRSYGAVRAVETPAYVGGGGVGGTHYTAPFLQAYATLYRTQPAVRTVVDFLARNIAQIGIHAFRRVSDTDRLRLVDHQFVQIISRPNPATTRYRLMETLMQDLGIYFNAYWLKVRTPAQLGLLRLPPEQVSVEGGLTPHRFIWTTQRGTVDFLPTEIVAFGGYDPCNPLQGLSPLETLRRILAEEVAATEYRQQFWLNSARLEAVISRPATAPKWNEPQRKQFTEDWRTVYSGPVNAGKTPILEDGMTITPLSHSAKESEYLGARKLAREEVAAAYHVPLPMVGILEHATFSNIKEQHKQLYQDALGPWCEMIVEEFERQILTECADTENVYLEFNLADKMKGSFEEQATALNMLVGRPVMTANEGRARLNLPSVPEGDTLAIQPGTGAAPRSATEPTESSRPAPPPPADDEPAARVVRDFWSRQAARIAKQSADERATHFDAPRWNAELAADLAEIRHPDPLGFACAVNAETRERLARGLPLFTADRPLPQRTAA